MAERDPGPRPLSWSLTQVASRIKRLDLVGFAAIEAAWEAVEAAVASGATPTRLANGELVVAVESGAHAARARRDAPAILAELAQVLADPPASLRVVVRPHGASSPDAPRG